MLELEGMQSTPLLPSLPDSLRPEVVAPGRVLSMRHVELFDIQTECKKCKIELLEIKQFLHLTLCKQTIDV